MIRLFAMLVTITCDSLEKRISVGVFARSILALGAYEPAPGVQDQSLLNEHKDEIKSAESISEIFNILSAYLNYLNYELLEYIIELYGTSEDIERLRSYEYKLRRFCGRRIFELPSPVSGSGVGNKQSLKFCVMLNVREDITVKEIRRIRIKIAKILLLNPSALIIQNMYGGIAQPQTSEGQP